MLCLSCTLQAAICSTTLFMAGQIPLRFRKGAVLGRFEANEFLGAAHGINYSIPRPLR